MLRKFTIGCLVAITLLFTVGCQKQETITSTDPQIQRIIKLAGNSADKSMEKELIYLREVKKLNLSTFSYSDGKDTHAKALNRKEAFYEYFYDGGWDVVVGIIPRKELQEEMKNLEESSNTLNRHRINSSMATSGTKTINLLNGTPFVWVTSVANARTAWNGIGQTLTFTAQSGGIPEIYGMINVVYTDFSKSTIPSLIQHPNAIAAGFLPINGIVQNLYINSNYTTTLSSAQRKFIMTHELGHCIGFVHTDTYEGSAIANVSSLSSCRNNPDAKSVLKQGISPVPTWNFSPCDTTVFSYFY